MQFLLINFSGDCNYFDFKRCRLPMNNKVGQRPSIIVSIVRCNILLFNLMR